MPALPVVPALLLAALSFQLPDTEGVRHTSAEFRQSKAVVFAFVPADGPMANGYAGTLARLYAAYAPRGVSFYGVDSDPEVSARRLGLPFPVLLDRRRQLARLAGAKSTPEVAVLSPAGEVLYRGRVDTLGPTLDAILAGRRVSTPTFARDVAPILYRHCAICHHPGEVAPFPLLTYQDAAKRAKLIATVTASRYMPPWQPEPGYVHFQGERRLRDADIATLRRWAEAGAPQGDPAKLQPAPHYLEGWQLGTPDMTIRMPKPFAIAADGPDQYMCFDIPLHLTADKYVRALEFRPEARSVVHHALFLLDSGHIGRQLGESYSCFGTPGFLPSGALGGWTPGMQPARMPDGLQLILRKGSDLVMQIHYHPTGKPETDRSTLGLYFTDKPPTKWVMDIEPSAMSIAPQAGDGHRAGLAPDRHSARRARLQGARPLHHAGGCGGGGDHPARALHLQRDAGLGYPAGRPQTVADPDSQLEFQLAGAIPLRHAGEAAGGHGLADGIHLRQFRCESAQSESSGAARGVGSGHYRRDGRSARAGSAGRHGRLARVGAGAVGQIHAERGRRVLSQAELTAAAPGCTVRACQTKFARSTITLLPWRTSPARRPASSRRWSKPE